MRLSILTAAGLLLALAQGTALAQEFAAGKIEYMNSCAVCHGPEGKGNGPLADELQTRPVDLTRLAEKNQGAFPFWSVYAVIDGRYIVPGHGGRDMPVWGDQFLDESSTIYGPGGGEIVARELILELAGYVQTLQR